MEMMRNEQDVKVAWENTESEMSITELQERPLTTQLRESEQRTKKTSFRGPESPLYNATCPYFYIARVLGLAPYDFDDELLVPSIIYMMISIVWICLNTYLIYFVLLNFTHTGSEDRKILRFTEVFKAGFNYGVVIFELFRCLITRREVAAIWNGIQDFDEILNGLGYIREERKARIWVWSTLVAATIIYILINQIGMHTFRQSWLYDVSYLIIYVESAASVMKFSGFVMLVAERFNYLNEISIECTSKQSKRMMGTSTVDINTIETLHHHMLTVAENLNSAYSWSILLWLMNLFLHSVCNLYFVSSWIVKTAFKLDLMTVFLIWIISFSAQLFVLNYVCHYASSEANRLHWIVLEWKRQLNIRDQIMVKITVIHDSIFIVFFKYSIVNASTLFLAALIISNIQNSFYPMLRPLNFIAAGCLHIDLSLLRSIVSSLTTYLVILLQFE